ncbi:MAG: serine hydrolase [Ignavibacteria bacterium]|nr:serine hydrolase [Ignavibacteria bacterium]
MSSAKSVRTALVLVVLFLFAQSALSQQEPFSGLDGYIVKALQDWETPGLAIAIVKNDAVIFAKGYGVRKMGGKDAVTPRTIFAVASTTKAMTVACLGMLVDQGKIKWDDPVSKYLPKFQLHDPYVTRELTVRDLLCHRSGLGRGDALWYRSAYSREEVLQRIRLLEPGWSFRSRYGYQNIMFIAAGEIIPSVTDTSWDNFMKERLFTPLGMSRSSTSVKALQNLDDVATPHARLNGVMQPVRWPNFDNVGAAGSVNSCVLDMAQWIRMNLGNGVYEGKKILSADVIKEIQTPQIVTRLDSLNLALRPSTHFSAYGLGWGLIDYHGRKIIHHTGSLDGMRTRVVLVPEEKLGFVIIFNSSNTSLHEALGYRILDHYLGAPARDWSAELLKNVQEEREKADGREKKRNDERVKDTKPLLPSGAFAGQYENEMYGTATVAEKNGKLTLSFYPGYEGEMNHWHYDTFQVVWQDRSLGKDFITFTLDIDGKPNLLKWEDFTDFARAK